jgi:hypothetical protein
VEKLELTQNVRRRVAVDLTAFVQDAAQDGWVLVSPDDVIQVLDRLSFITGQTRFDVNTGQTRQVWVRQGKAWGPVQPKIKPAPVLVKTKPLQKTPGRLRTLPIVLLSVGAALAGTGGVLNYLANRATDRVNAGFNELDRRRAYVIGSWTAYGTGLALGVTAVILWAVQGPRVPVHASITPNGAALTIGF